MPLARHICAKYVLPVPDATEDKGLHVYQAIPQHIYIPAAGQQLEIAHQMQNGVEELQADLEEKKQELSMAQQSKNEAHIKWSTTREDILGYSQSEQELMEEVTELREVLDRKCQECDILRETEVHHRKVKKQSEEKTKKLQLLGRMIQSQEEDITKLKQTIWTKEEELRKTRELLQQKTDELEIKAREYEEKCVQLQQLNARIDKLTVQITTEKRNFDMEIQHGAAKLQSQKNYIAQMELQLSVVVEEAKAKETEMEHCRHKLAHKDKYVTTLSTEVQNQKTRIKALHSQAYESNEQLTIKQQLLVSLRCELSTMEVKLAEATSEKQTLQQRIAQLISSIPDPKQCTAVVIPKVQKHLPTQCTIHLLNEDGDRCTGSHVVTGVLRSLASGSTTEVNTVSKSPDTYELSYTPHRSGKHEVVVKVNGREIQGSPIVSVYNVPDPMKCTATGAGTELAQKHQLTQFEVHLADEDGEPCTDSQEVTAVLKSLADGSTFKVDTLCMSPETYKLSYTSHKSGEYELAVKVNGSKIQGSSFKVFMYNTPDLKKCIAVGPGIHRVEKHQVTQFEVHLADEDGEPCNDANNTVTAVLRSLANGSSTEVNTVSKSPDTYKLSYTPHRIGEHDLTVKVNGREIQGSPFTVSVYNVPCPKKCTATGAGTKLAQKHQLTQFQVYLADEDGESCNTASVTAVIKSLTCGSTTEADSLYKSPDTYELSYTPHRSGKHDLTVKVNGREIQGSPFTVSVYNVPDPKKCTAAGIGTKLAQKHQLTKFQVHLVDEDGEPCNNTGNSVTAVMKSLTYGSTTEAGTLCKSPDTYKLSYTPHRIGEHEVTVKVNDSEIQGSPYRVFVYNTPDPKKCTAIGAGTEVAQKHQLTQFEVHLADEDGEPCTDSQEVTAVLKSLADGSTFNVDTLCKSPETYKLSYTSHKSGEHELAVKVNGSEIQGSSFRLFVYNTPDPQRCWANGPGVKSTETYQHAQFDVCLVDADGDPCVSTQEVTAESRSLVNDSVTPATVVCKTPDTYEASYYPSIRGQNELSVVVNGTPIQGSPFRVYVRHHPHLLGWPVRTISELSQPWRVATTSEGEIIVTESNRLSFLTKDGQRLKTIDSVLVGVPGQNLDPTGVAVDGEGNIYVTDMETHRLFKFSSKGKMLKSVGGKGEKTGQFNNPDGIAIRNNNVYVCDNKNHRIQVFSTDLSFISSFGTRGSGEGQFQYPTDLAFDSTGNLYVAGSYNDSIQVFSPSGTFLRQFGSKGEGPGQLSFPCGIHVDHDYVYVVECGNNRVSIFNTSGGFISSFSMWGRGVGELYFPCGVTTDQDGYVYVCDSSSNRIQVF